MGAQQYVTFGDSGVPRWTVVHELLQERGFPVEMRMINGELAFPDETPDEPWQELRLGTPDGMITVRQEGDGLALVVWGNAETAIVRAWNALTWAFAEAGNGQIRCSSAPVSAAEFKRSVDLPPCFEH